MADHGPAPGVADVVAAEYFATMRRFLEAQQRAMAAFLGAAPTALPAVQALPATAAVRRQAVAGIAPPVAEPIAPQVAAPAAPEPAAMPRAETTAHAETPAAAAPAGDAIAAVLLGIVEEKTGYPRDLLGLDQNLESDLGIDSIKRIEIVGALLQQLPEAQRQALAGRRTELNTRPTLGGMLALLAAAPATPAPVLPASSAATAPVAAAAPAPAPAPPRWIMQARAEALPADAARKLLPGRFVLTADAAGVAAALAAQLQARGNDVVLLDAGALADEGRLLEASRAIAAAGAIAGIVHLAPLGAPPLSQDGSPDSWRAVLQRHEKSLFLLLRESAAQLAPEAHVMAASGLGGLFGRAGSAAGLHLEGGAVGALKSFRAERPTLRVRAVDLDPSRSAEALSADLLGELELVGGRQEVGYPGGVRTVFETVAEEAAADGAREAALDGLIVLATGGARGITAETLRGIARPGNVLVLTGRSALAEEDADTAGLPDGAALRQHLVSQVRTGRLALTPGAIQRRVQSILAQREMHANIADLRAAGATVEYHTVDVTNEAGIAALMADIASRHGAVNGVVHGAGVIEDKLLADKQGDSWSRVVETKVIGLLLLQKYIDPAALRFFTVFSSVAGRYGNSGQSDYATANELMNRLCAALDVRWQGRVAVSALCWGPWGPTTHGAGMVTAETEAKFAEQGVRLVSAELGRRLFRQELARPAGRAIEVVCGEAAWESREAELGAIVRAAGATAAAGEPLLGSEPGSALPTGERILPLTLDPARHLYLHEHALDGKLVLPAAAALELMAEAARSLWPGWQVAEVGEHKLLKGVELAGAPRALRVLVQPPPYGSSEGFEVTAALQSEAAAGRWLSHYRCTVRLEQMLPPPMPAPRRAHRERALGIGQAYDEWLFHGPRFRVIEQIDGLSSAGAGARVRRSAPGEWLAGADGARDWVFDPALLDAAAQMAWLWSRAYRDESALPTRFGRVVRYRAQLPARMHMEYERIATDDATLVRGNVVFFDEAGEPVLAIEELDSVASAALNRFGGTARVAAGAAA